MPSSSATCAAPRTLEQRGEPSPSRGDAGAAATLDLLVAGVSAVVARVDAPADAPHWAGRLEELGFIPGERVRVTGRAWPGGDPLAVRVGSSTFALRRAEAACVVLEPAGRT